jgi:hypothetical protein
VRPVLGLALAAVASAQTFPFPGPGPATASAAPIAFVNSVCAGGAAGATTPATNMAGANYFIMSVGSGGTPTCSDSTGANTWHNLTAYGSAASVQFCYAEGATASSTQTFSTSGSYPGFCVLGFSGIQAASSFVTGSETGGSTYQPGNVTPGLGGPFLVVTGAAFSSTFTAPSVGLGFSSPVYQQYEGSNNYGAAISYLIQTSGSTVNPPWTSSPGATNGAAFK